MLPERRYAEWLPGKVSRKHSPFIGVGFVIGNLSMLAAIGVATFGSADLFKLYWPEIAVFLVSGNLLIAFGVFHENRLRSSRLPMLDQPSTIQQFPVFLTLSREVNYGETEGFVSFVDGWLVFSGKELSFSVRKSDVRFGIDDGKMLFEFETLHGKNQAQLFSVRGSMQKVWIEWLRATDLIEGTPIYPPAIPSPTYVKRPIKRWFAAVSLIFGLASIQAVPAVGAFDIAVAAALLYADLSETDALKRLAQGQPPKRTGLRATIRSLLH